MIKMVDVLGLKEKDYKDYKMHFATGGKDNKEPYDLFLRNQFADWQSNQTNRNFQRDYVISLIYYDKDVWMFAGVYKVNDKNPQPIKIDNWNGWHYNNMVLIDTQKDLVGRMLLSFKKNPRNSYLTLEYQSEDTKEGPRDIYVHSILDERITIEDFKGFDKVNISYQTLKYIIDNNLPTWKSALSNVKGIYLIVDTANGKQYVGSANGEDCLWQRWSDYAKNGHGGNKELQALLKAHGNNYKDNFKYSILEVCNLNLGTEYILSRETYWKEVLMTRQFGLNSN